MAIAFTPTHRALAAGGLAAAALIGAFALGSSHGGSAAPLASGQTPAGTRSAELASVTGATRITVTGTGTVTGTPNQLVLGMGVQVNGSSVGSALAHADDAVNRVTAALRGGGVAAADIQTSGLSIWPSYPSDSQTPSGYSVSESLTATLNNLTAAGTQIDAAVHAGGDATTVSGISLNLTDTSPLLSQARVRAVADATAKAAQYAKALGEPLGPVVSITDQVTTQPSPMVGFASAASAKSSVPISPGTQQLSVSITVIFAA
ncbi:MAG TPA: SIMPL domain-containing protein [Trebonia sp.]